MWSDHATAGSRLENWLRMQLAHDLGRAKRRVGRLRVKRFVERM
jgi:hypothetical protein